MRPTSSMCRKWLSSRPWGWTIWLKLGPTLRDIAAAKAGIIKPGRCVVSYGGSPEADAVIRRVCREQRADLTEVDFSRLSVQQADLQGTRFDFSPHRNLELPLAGAYQPRNAAAAITALECLARKGWSVPEEALRRGLAAVQWPGRFEVLRRHPAVILDGAHNAHGMRATVESLRQMFPGQRVTLILGILEDKDVEQMLDLLTPVAGTAFVIRPESPRAMAPEALCARLECRGVTAYPCPDVQAAVDAALRTAGKTGQCAPWVPVFRRCGPAGGAAGRRVPINERTAQSPKRNFRFGLFVVK